MSEELVEKSEQIEVSKREDGRHQIIFKKSILKGKVSSSDVLNTILIAARMQAEKYIIKLSKGATLDPTEVKALKELSEITKLEVSQPKESQNTDAVQIDTIKSTLYTALMSRNKEEE